MAAIDWSDLALPLTLLVTFAALFGLQYLLLAKTTRRWVRALPFAVPALPAIRAVQVLYGPGGGFLDLRPLIAFLLGCYAALCLAAVLLARLVWRLRLRRAARRTPIH